MLNTEVLCHQYLETQPPLTIALQIRRDQQLCRSQRLPSLLALYLPSRGSQLGDKIALELFPDTAQYGRAITRAQYAGVIESIKEYLRRMDSDFRLAKLPSIGIPELKPSKEDLEAALRVVDFYLDGPDKEQIVGLHLKTPIGQLITNIKTDLLDSASQSNPQSKTIEAKIPRIRTKEKPCGDFNLASSDLSLPRNLELHGKTAIVTGGRINLGYFTALRLLRSGARVIVTSRYPYDAAMRYTAEKDFDSWSESLKIIGADFRASRDAFNLVEAVKEQLEEWDEDGVRKLDILINNAAQTWTDSIDKEKQAIDQEEKLKLESSNRGQQLILQDISYEPRIRGGIQEAYLLPNKFRNGKRLLQHIDSGFSESTTDKTLVQVPENSTIVTRDQDSENPRCSWFQKLHEIPYEDVISAHSVNTFVPFILIRELIHLMGATPTSAPPTNKPKPQAYIINVTAREGIFESSTTSHMKRGHHVHTNIAKAALNMLTETESGPAWKERRVAMNSVDPGYLSAPKEATEREDWEECPLGWEDGAARVLWPIAVGEKGRVVWGRFLKDYGGWEVDVGMGR